jgi:mannose-6-phosphate isomerase-like protein (cupin superfamily)
MPYAVEDRHPSDEEPGGAMNVEPAQAFILGPGEGPQVTTTSTSGPDLETTVVKASGEDTRGAYTLRERVISANQPPVRLHRHHRMEEAFYVLEGEMAFRVGDQTITVGSGSFVFVPRGVIHTFSNPTDRPARCLFFFSPPGFERYFEELAAIRSADPSGRIDAEVLESLSRKYHTEYFDLPDRI